MTGALHLASVAGALAVTLGLFLVGVRILRRAMPRGEGAGATLEVVGRVHLAPRQGVATVRAGERTLLLSFGEGGVRMLAELDASQGVAPEVEEAPLRVAHLPFARILRGARRAAGTVVLAVALAGGAHAELAAAPVASMEADLVQVPAPSGAPSAVVPVPQGAGQATPGAVPRPPAGAAPGGPPALDLNVGVGSPGREGLRVQGPVGTVLFLGALTLLPTLLLLMTSFTRVLIVLHLLKQALGTQTAPPAHLLSAMALLLTAFIMGPTLEEANRTALVPWLDGQIDEAEMLRQASVPFRDFMLTQVREADLATFAEMRPEPLPESVDELPMVVVTSAFVTSELRSAFQMGFALFLPFVVIDLVVASVLMSMGMFMLPPVMISLPFKLLLFVMVDGWSILVGSLVRSFA